MEKPARKSGVILYLVAVSAVIASFALLIIVYIIKCPFDLPSNAPAQGVARPGPLETYENGGLLVETDVLGFNALLMERRAQIPGVPGGLTVSRIYCEFNETPGSQAGALYINITDDGLLNVLYSFKCRWELTLGGSGAVAELSDISLGKYELPYIGDVIWKALGLPESLPLPSERDDGLLRLSSFEAQKGGRLLITYKYDPAVLAETLNGALALSDERKTEFHRRKGDIDDELLRIAEARSATEEEAAALVARFEKSPEDFYSLCCLLSAEGVHKLYDSFGKAFYRNMDADKIVETSENELNAGLNEYHRVFSRQLLYYLYRNPGYTVENGSLYLDGSEITPDTILPGGGNTLYDVRILADKTSITIVYGFSGLVAEKAVLNEAWEYPTNQ